MIAIQNELNNGTYVEPSVLTLSDYLKDWFKLKKTTISHQTRQVYENILRVHILPKLGNMKIVEIKTVHVQSYINELFENGYAPETIKKIYNIMRNALEHAVDIELVPSNSATKVKVPSIQNRIDMIIWDKKQINRFLEVAKKDRYYVLFNLALLTGMRQGEILGLRWKDIDLKTGILKVSQTLSHDGKQFLQGAKSKSSIRSIALPLPTVQLLKEHKNTILKEKTEFGEDYYDNDLVVCTKIGTALNPANARRVFNRLIKEAEVPKIRFHDMRHTHATLLLSQGVNVKVISERLGHSNIKITLDTYSHVLPAMQQEAVQKLNDIVTDFDPENQN